MNREYPSAAAAPPAGTTTRLDADHLHVLDLDGEAVPYSLRRSLRRKRAMLSLHDHGLVLAVPVRMSARAIDTFLQHSLPWLRRHLPRWRALAERDARLFSLQEVLLFGQPLRVQASRPADPAALPAVRGAARVRVVHEADEVRLVALHAPCIDASRAALRDWIRGLALPWFDERARVLAPQIGVTVPPLRLSNARTLWGSCAPDGRVRLNWRLLQAPPRLIDYVIAHELSHLIERNHSARFWAVVARACADHRAARQELSEWQRRLAVL